MARFLAGLFAVIAAILLAHSAVAQFGQQFELPPRPPGNIPNRPEVPQAPQVQPPNVPPANQPRPRDDVQSLPLPPPPGAREMPAAPRQQIPSAQRPGPGAVWQPLQPNLAAPIRSGSRTAHAEARQLTAVFSGLDKITGRIITFDVAIDEDGALRCARSDAARLLHAPADRIAPDRRLCRSRRTHGSWGTAQHFYWLDGRSEPRAECGRTADLRCLAYRL